ncbi:MAG: hypothetical protein BWX45_00388 [Deltaproteobacteria bacterium ADurb.Bin002]|nr:MAG: hypothetical protein BWX45_00388 [Deltaproteobacteria bacterium ADurb.Bin002]
MKVRHSTGVSTMATTKEAESAMETVSGKAIMKSFTMPDSMTIGKKAAMMVMVAVRMGTTSSVALFQAAVCGRTPLSRSST